MSYTDIEGLKLQVSDRLAVVTIDRPKRKNAFNKEMYVGLTKILNDLSERPDVSITVITGTGDFYSSGNDLAAAFMDVSNTKIEDAVIQANERIRKFVEAFITHKKVLVAVVNGPAIGIAVTTLPLCDIVFCTPSAWFSTPFSQLGICAEGCSSYTFPLLLGTSKANEMLLLAGKLSAEEALSRGFVSRIVDLDNLEEQVWDVLRRNAAQLSPKSLQASKRLMRRFTEDKLHESNRLECNELRKLFFSQEAQEAVINFMSRRSKL